MMDFRLTDHARKELLRRQIPRSIVDMVLARPEQIVPETAGRKAYQSKVDIHGKMFLIRAIVDDSVSPAVVITVYRTSKISKYWRT
jgi:hypothetical protein